MSKTKTATVPAEECAGSVSKAECTAEARVFKVTLQNKRVLLIRAKSAEVSEAEQPASDDAKETTIFNQYATLKTRTHSVFSHKVMTTTTTTAATTATAIIYRSQT